MFTNPVKCKQCGQAFRDSKRESAWSKLEDHVQLMHGRRASYKSKAAALRRVRKSRESAEEAEGPAPLTGYLSYEGYENPSADISLIPYLGPAKFLRGPASKLGLGLWETAAVLHAVYGPAHHGTRSGVIDQLAKAPATARESLAHEVARQFGTPKVQAVWHQWLQTSEGQEAMSRRAVKQNQGR